MTKASDNLFPGVILRESADDGSDFSNPAADYRRVFLGEDGDLHAKDSAGTVTNLSGGGAGGSYHVLAETIVSGSPAANIDFTSISGAYRHLEIYLTVRANDAAAFVLLNVQFNGDTGANYDWQRTTITNATQGGSATAGATAARMGLITSTGASATNNPGGGRLFIPHYAGTVFNKTALSYTTEFQTTTNTGFLSEQGHMLWRSTAAITRVTLTPSAGSFIVGSMATLYGLDHP